MNLIGEKTPKSLPGTSIKEALDAAEEIGYPVVIRPAYTLGGSGGGVAKNQEMLEKKFLATNSCYANYRHDTILMKKYELACQEIFNKIAKLEKTNKLKKSLKGPVKLMGFKRLTS